MGMVKNQILTGWFLEPPFVGRCGMTNFTTILFQNLPNGFKPWAERYADLQYMELWNYGINHGTDWKMLTWHIKDEIWINMENLIHEKFG